MREIETLEPAFDPEPAHRLGLVSLASDPVSSDEIRAVCAVPGTAIHETRIMNDDTITADSLRAMEARLTEAAGRLPPCERYDAAAFLCTSGARLIGAERVGEAIRAALPGAAVTDPMTAGLRACEAVGARRIAVVTPYVAEVTEALVAGFEDGGLEVTRAASFFVDSDRRVARIGAHALARAAAQVIGEADAVFISCTALRTVDLAGPLEAELGRPVLSSNLAVAWDLLHLSGASPVPGRHGMLLDRLGASSR